MIKNNSLIHQEKNFNKTQTLSPDIFKHSDFQKDDKIQIKFDKNNLNDDLSPKFSDSKTKHEELNDDLDQKDIDNEHNDDEEEIEIIELIPELNIDEPDSSDIFKRKMIQIILEFQIDNEEAIEALFEATIDKNPNIDQESLKEMFAEIQEFIEIYNNGELDLVSDEEDD